MKFPLILEVFCFIISLQMVKPKFKRLVRETYLQMIKNSSQSRLFRNLFVIDRKGKKSDALKNGRSSCAFFISCILKIFSLISFPHATVDSTMKDMLGNGWRRTKKLNPGNVLLWEKKRGHKHLGFFIGDNKAISNSFEIGVPRVHHYTYGKTENNQPKRKIEQIFTHSDIK